MPAGVQDRCPGRSKAIAANECMVTPSAVFGRPDLFEKSPLVHLGGDRVLDQDPVHRLVR